MPFLVSRLILLFVILLALPSGFAGHSANDSKHSVSSASAESAEEPCWSIYQIGVASWYGGRWHRCITANGERYDQNSMTAAHRELPFGTLVLVTNVHNGNCCVVRIKNRGPSVRRRVIDLSRAAAKQLGLYCAGVGRVKLEVMRRSSVCE
jgi:rare lipoprotein A